MRTNIEIDDALLRKAMRACGKQTKRATVEAGLRVLVRLHDQQRLLGYFGKIPLEDEEAAESAAAGHRR